MMSPITYYDKKPMIQFNVDHHKWVRLTGLILIVGVIITSLIVTGKMTLSSFHQIKIVPAITIPSILLIGGAIVIHRAREKGLAQGKVSGNDHWRELHRALDKPAEYLDLSLVNAEGTGDALLFNKPLFQASVTGLGLALIIPLYVACVVVYNALRFLIIPFYILARIIQEKRSGKALYPDERAFRVSDIPKEMGLSLWRIFKAPFFGVALFYAGLKAIVDPLNGVKEGAAIEYDWNERVPLRYEGIWMLSRICFPNWKWEGGGGPLSLGRNGFYAAGSWQPWMRLRIVKWQFNTQTEVDGSYREEKLLDAKIWYVTEDIDEEPKSAHELKKLGLKPGALLYCSGSPRLPIKEFPSLYKYIFN